MPEPNLRTDAGGRAVHDVGGLEFGGIDRSEHDLALWEKRVDAMMAILFTKRHLFTVDAMRRTIEGYAEQTYDKTEYYEKWVRALRNLLVEQDVLSAAEIDARTADVAERQRKAGRTVAGETVDWS
jgi:hypothetical protein